MICAAYRNELMERHYMNERQRDRYVGWAKPFHESIRDQIGSLDGDIFTFGTDMPAIGRHADVMKVFSDSSSTPLPISR